MARTKFDENLTMMHQYIVQMTNLVTANLAVNFEAFAYNDMERAGQAITRDERIDELHRLLEKHVMNTLAMAYPLAGHDLRDIMASILIAYELERMGDYAKSIGRYMIKHEVSVTGKAPSQLADMKQHCTAMLERAIEAYTHGDVDSARRTVLQDDTVDSLKRVLFDETIGTIQKGEISVEEGTYLLWVGHKLERFADRTVTISKRAAYVSLGHTPYFEE